jgi:hypothetical protein
MLGQTTDRKYSYRDKRPYRNGATAHAGLCGFTKRGRAQRLSEGPTPPALRSILDQEIHGGLTAPRARP